MERRTCLKAETFLDFRNVQHFSEQSYELRAAKFLLSLENF